MPEGRMLKKKISFDEKLAELSLETLLVFTWTIPHLDVKGRILGDPAYIKATVFPLIDKISVKKIKKCLNELADLELILIYGDKIKYIQFNGFLKNQKISPDREAKSTIPDPDLLTSNSRVTHDTSLKLSKSLNSSLKLNVKGEGQSQDQEQPTNGKLQTSNLEISLPLLTEISDYAPIDYENREHVTEAVKNLLSSFCNKDNPDKATLSSFTNIVMNTKQVKNRTAFEYLFNTFNEFHTYPIEKRNLRYVYKRVKGRINDALIEARERKAKQVKLKEKQEMTACDNEDVSQLTNKMKID